MLSCERMQHRLPQYVADGEPTTSDGDGVRAHLRLCVQCSAYADRLRVAEEALRTYPPMAPDPSLRHRITQAVAAEEARELVADTFLADKPVVPVSAHAGQGLDTLKDALHAAAEGVDAIGLVFYEKSPRYVTATQAAEICNKLPAFVTSVALFKDADADTVRQILTEVPIDLLQFHGSESAEFCRQFGKPYIKALGMGHDTG